MSPQNNNLAKIEHIVVLMMENRSFDNVLGWLYGPNNPPPRNQTFYGVNTTMCNPRPDGGSACVYQGTDMTAPFPDPNELYDYMYMQMYNVSMMTYDSPPEPIPNTTASPAMQGFVIDYNNAIQKANADAKKHGRSPFVVDPGVIMSCFGPASLPVINGLAQAYAVCDSWFGSVPTQTFPNRSFVHAATSSGNVYNTWKTGIFPWDIGVFINNTPTIFNLLEETAGKVSWKIYHCGYRLLCNALYDQMKMWDFLFSDKITPFSSFLTDVKSGGLANYTFIEPNMMCSQTHGPENDMHPAYAIVDTGAPTNVLYGDQLIYDVYKALRESDYWEKTLFIITFDEHGGCFDHVPTPQPLAVSPDGVVIPPPMDPNGGSGFEFNRFGVRVPAVLVSPWIQEGTICHTQFDHTSVIKTVSNRWLGGEYLTQRDLNASDVSEVLTLTKPRTDKPNITPITPPEFKGCGSVPLSALQRDALVAAKCLVEHAGGTLLDLAALDTKEKVAAALDDAESLLRRK